MYKLLRVAVIVIFVVGSIGLAESRAVNISNMWTLPQEGFSVFYRYFRDKISWLEADAVCQFHHANLVTVDNGVQFDATRAFLKELDVTNAVWIGLKRPENSKRFTWTSSKTLDPSSGYWAEIIPAIEQPLCAAVDPMRDFRWHALRCGGPETAAFLCELPVPTWAVDCTVSSIPSLTVQYMSDSGTVQLSRDCGESGTKHISCQGKQDRNTIIEQLQCSEEENLASVLAIDNSNQILLMFGVESVTEASSTSRPEQQPILEHDILTVVSSIDQENNNKIEINPHQIEDTMKNVINKVNLQGLMRSEQAGLRSDEQDNLGHEAEFPRTSGAHLPPHEKKNSLTTSKSIRSNWNDSNNEDDEGDEMIIGDQPMQDETETQPIDIIQQAVKPTADVEYPDTVLAGYEIKPVNNEIVTTPDSRSRRETDSDRDEEITINTTKPMLDITSYDIKKLSRTTISDPNVISPVKTVTDISLAKKTTKSKISSRILPTTSKIEVITGDHFIPPMLLVKARFIYARPSTESFATTLLPYVSSTYIPAGSSIRDHLLTTIFPKDRKTNKPPLYVQSTSMDSILDVSQDKILSIPTVATSTTDLRQVILDYSEKNQSKRSEPLEMLIAGTRSVQVGKTTAEQISYNQENHVPSQIPAIESTFQLMQSAGLNTTTLASFQETGAHISKRPKPNPVDITTIIKEIDYTSTPHTQDVKDISDSSTLNVTVTAIPKSTMIPHPELNLFSKPVNPTTLLGEIKQNLSYDEPSSMLFTRLRIEIPKKGKSISEIPYLYHKTTNADEQKSLQYRNDAHMFEKEADYDEQKHTELHNSFSNIENYQPYKPNRRRALAKPEVP